MIEGPIQRGRRGLRCTQDPQIYHNTPASYPKEAIMVLTSGMLREGTMTRVRPACLMRVEVGRIRAGALANMAGTRAQTPAAARQQFLPDFTSPGCQ